MSRKLFVLLMILLLAGCAGREKPAFVAVLEKPEEDKAVVAFADAAGKMNFSREIEIPVEVYFGDGGIYFSTDYQNYDSVSYKTYDKGDRIENARGFLLYHDADTITAFFNDSAMMFVRNGELVREYDWSGAEFFKALEGKLYVAGLNTLRVFDLDSCELLAEQQIVQSSFYGLCEIENKTYLVLDTGYMDVQEGVTYLYPRVFDGIISCHGNVLTVAEKEEINLYYVSFDSRSMILEDDFDDQIGEIVFDDMFGEYIEKGYEVVYFQDYRN